MSKALEKKTILTIAIIGGIFLMAAIIIGIVIAATPDTPPAPLDALEKPKNLRITDGILTWDSVPDATQYTVKIEGQQYTVTDTQYTLPTYSASKTVTVYVTANGDGKDYTDSPTSSTVYVYNGSGSTTVTPPEEQTATPGLEYTPINDGAEYEVSIGSVASNVKSIYIPDAHEGKPITSLGSFNTGAYNWTSIRLPSGLTNISEQAFACNSLSINGESAGILPLKLKEITIPNSVTQIGASAFSYCMELETVILPEGITEIPDSMFNNCSSLYSVTPLNAVTTIGTGAFKNTRIPASTKFESATSIGSNAFDTTPFLAGFPEGFIVIGKVLYDYKGIMPENLVIDQLPDDIVSITSGLFKNATKLKKAVLPNSLTSIPSATFSGCKNLESVTLPDELISIDTSAFANCSALTSITLPDKLINIGPSAFLRCSNLQEITFGNSLQTIGMSAFMLCSSLKSVVLPDSVTTIGFQAFAACSSLTEFTLSSSLTTMEGDCFSQCTKLKSITIPEGITELPFNAFIGLSALKILRLPNGFTTLNCDFNSCKAFEGLIVPISLTARAKAGNKTITYYYMGTPAQWEQITVTGDENVTDPHEVYYYSEAEPEKAADGTAYIGNYWHYDTDGATPIKWEILA